MISLNQLQYIVTLDKTKNFSKAAEECHVSQPTLSMQLKKAEDTLGIKIFDRDRVPLKATKAGERIIAQGRVVLDEYEKLVHDFEDISGNFTGELNIGIIPTISPYLLPKFYGSIKKQWSSVELTFFDNKTDEILEKVKSGALDVGILSGPLEDENLKQYTLYYEPILLFYKGSKVKDQMDLLQHRSPWLLSEGNCFRMQMINLCDIDENSEWEYQGGSIETLVRMVEENDGFTLIPALAEDVLKSRKGTIEPLGEGKAVREIVLVTRSRFSRSYMLQELIDVIQQQVPKDWLDGEGKEMIDWR